MPLSSKLILKAYLLSSHYAENFKINENFFSNNGANFVSNRILKFGSAYFLYLNYILDFIFSRKRNNLYFIVPSGSPFISDISFIVI